MQDIKENREQDSGIFYTEKISLSFLCYIDCIINFGGAIMKVFPSDTEGWALWLMHGLETFILVIFMATIFGIRVEYGIYGERLILLNCVITPALIIMSIVMFFMNKREATIGLEISMVGIAMVLWLLPALNR